jgi:hypothetical protein
MKRNTTLAVLAIGIIVVLSVSSFAVAQPQTAKFGVSPAITPDAAKLISVCYYDNGGTPHAIEKNTTAPGTGYPAASKDILIKATGSWKGSGGMGYVEIYNTDTLQNYVTKLVPNGKTVSAMTPAALWIDGRNNLSAFVVSPGGTAGEYTYFYFE